MRKLIFILWCALLWPLAAEAGTLSGTVAYRERMALPPNARLEVSLVDVSLADAPARVIARDVVSPAGQPPIRYRLSYRDNQIRPGRSYALQARITVGGRLLFTTTERHAVFDGGPERTDLLVRRVAGGNDGPDEARQRPDGRWRAVEIGGRPASRQVESTLEIAGGRAAGSGGCNHYTGPVRVEGETIRFGAVVATRMMCQPNQMRQEARLFDALESVRGWRIVRGRLELTSRQGRVLARFARQ